MKLIKTLFAVLLCAAVLTFVIRVALYPVPTPLTPVRALWVTRFDYTTPEDVRRIINNVAEAGFTDVFFQIRGNGTTFYKSEIEPWAYELSGERLPMDENWSGIVSMLVWVSTHF